MFTTCDKQQDACAAFIFGCLLITGLTIGGVGFFYINADYDEYVDNKPFATTCEILNYSIITDCEYPCNCTHTEDIEDCAICANGVQFVIEANADTSSYKSQCPLEHDTKFVEHETECYAIGTNWTSILQTFESNDTITCYISRHCEKSDAFYTSDYNEVNRPAWNGELGDDLMLAGVIVVGAGIVCITCHLMYFKLVKK
mmetsp:Transcript_46656/g.74729  ORF Transcript_46656/g.74729 Transcript_46656/m.74729 type:complete len:200 (+) Transcript_46656:48-647(+)